MKTNILLVGIVCLLTGLLIGTYAEKSVSATNTANTTITARNIRLIDAQGHTRIFISAGGMPDLSCALYMLDRNGKNRVLIGEATDDNPKFGLYSAGGKGSVGIAVAPNSLGLVLTDDNGNPRGIVALDHGTSLVQLFNSSEKMTSHLP